MINEQNRQNRRSAFVVTVIVTTIICGVCSACGSAATVAPAATEPPVLTINPPNTPTIAPVLTNTPLATPNIDELIESAINNLGKGLMLFNPPSMMKQGEIERVELRVSAFDQNIQPTQVEATLSADLKGKGAPTVEPITTSKLMKAKLIGDAFEITPLNQEEQIVSNDTYTEWAWNIKALKSGEQELNLSVSVKINVDKVGEKSRDIPVITKKVAVSINPVYTTGRFLDTNWQWLITALIIPVAAWGWSVYKSNKDEEKKKREEDKKRA